MRVCVVGLGYIGLPVAATLASRGHEVIGYDINQTVVDSLRAGRAHFFEPDLDMLLNAAITTNRLIPQTEPVQADYFVIAVPTPVTDGNKPDLSSIDAAITAISPVLTIGCTIILESTSPVGTTESISRQLSSLRPDLSFPQRNQTRAPDVFLAHCPERILPGQMVHELVTNDRIIGGITPACSAKAIELYRSFVTASCYITDSRTAEFVKLIENSYRDVNIAFANELSMICDYLDLDVWTAISLANKHPRVSILKPGAGVGGHCIAVDPWFIVHSAPEQTRLISAARLVNDHKPLHVVGQVLSHSNRFKNPVVACFGLTYKPNVEDLRESPALEIVKQLAKTAELQVVVCEPNLKELPPELRSAPNVRLVGDDEAIRESDVVAFLVAHNQFKFMNMKHFLSKIVVDAVGLAAELSVSRAAEPGT